MAYLSAGTYYTLNTSSIDFTPVFRANVAVISSKFAAIGYNYLDYLGNIRGSDLSSQTKGKLTGGTVTDFSISYKSQSLYDFSGVALSADYFTGRIQYNNATLAADLLSGNDMISSGKQSDKIDAFAGNDTIFGSDGNDWIFGNDGADLIFGEKGNDTLAGGQGRDVFVMNERPNKKNNVDTINDFEVGIDKIQLDSRHFDQEGWGSKLKSTSFRKGIKAKDYNDRIIYDSKHGNIYYDVDGNGSKAKVLFAKVSQETPLTHKDFYLV